MNITSKDLNLLRVFQILWLERNVSKAAVKLGLSQPALSNALARLRLEFNDALFVRASRGIVPTPTAEKIHSQVELIIQEASRLYEEGNAFDPKTSDRVFTIMATDYFEQLLLPELLQMLEREAPHMKLISKSLSGKLPKEQMEQQECDLAIAGYFKQLPEGFYQQQLFKDEFSCVVRPGHPVLKEKLTIKKYLQYKHVLINPSGDLKGTVDELLAKDKLERLIIAGTSSFMAPGRVIQRTDFILTAPDKLCQHFKEVYQLVLLPPPLKIPAIKVVQVWHQRVHNDPPARWLRSKIAELSVLHN